MDLSIVIPAFREAAKIRRDVEAAGAFLAQAGLTGEIIVVDDGSPDGTCDAARSAEVPPGVGQHVICLLRQSGKGAAVRAGMAASHGDFAMFADVGLCVPFEYVLKGMEMIRRSECDIAHGSRKLPGSIILRPQGFYRRLCSRLFRFIVRLFMGIPHTFSDTQCGFKIYRGDVARKLYGECLSSGFMFDVEILLRALRRGYAVKEFPVEWRCDLDSRVHPARGAARTFSELSAIKKTLKPGT
ncbi:MAG: glycosyltransferase [Planctomycetota bacterium]|nr:glycosyltransferase [Planctomycetota bacterium]